MVSVFLSYDRDDLDSARPLAQALEEAGHSVWWDRHIKGGVQYSKEIDQALAAADAVLVLWSANAIESAWVRDEAEAGRDLGRLVPATLDGSRPPLGFRQYQTIDLTEWRRTGDPLALEPLLATLGGAGAAEGRPAPAQRQRKARRSPSSTRRGILVGGSAAAALAVAGGGVFLYRRMNPALPPEVENLMVQAEALASQNNKLGQDQAMGLYQRVVELAPDYAKGWGRLGLVYAVASHYRQRPESTSFRAKAESAGRRALELDPDSVYGELALAVARPFIGSWAEWDRRMTKALAKDPRNDDLLTYRAVMLQFEGRASEAVPLYQRIRKRPLLPAVYTNYIQALWSSGRLIELDQAMADAASLYPTQPSIWFARFNILSFDRRTDAAIALLESREGRPANIERNIPAFARTARAIQSRDPAEVKAIVAADLADARNSASDAEYAIRDAAALGRVDDAFALADAYYFSRGYAIPDFHGAKDVTLNERQTRLLFEPVTKPMRADPRFERLVADLGFDRYWKQSGNQPDYRKS